MLSEKNTLCRLSLLSLTGCRAGSSGQRPFCSSASTSVPGAPASSLATRSQELGVERPALEISAPDWVAVALLATRQPCAPRSVDVAGTGRRPRRCWPARPRGRAAETPPADEPGWPARPGPATTSEVATQAIEAQMARGGRMARFTAGNS